jgi:Phage portal protein, SPP1 Gp6-like
VPDVPTPDSNLEWAVHEYQPSIRRYNYTKYWNYNEGNHPMAYATEKYRGAFYDVFKDFAENVCPGVVDALNDRLTVTGFVTDRAELVKEEAPSQMPSMPGGPPMPARVKLTTKDDEGERAWDIWKRNRMDQRSTAVHEESLLMGDSYVIVWPDEEMQAAIWPQCAEEINIQYDKNTHKILRASKAWWDDLENKWYLNIYTDLGIWKYESTEKSNTLSFPQRDSLFSQVDFVPNIYGRVPVFSFHNRTEMQYGVSELKDIVPVQDALNKSDVDLLVAMEFASFKQRYIIGMETEIDEQTGEPVDAVSKNYGVDRLLGIPDPEAKVGQFDATDLGQFLRVQDKFWASVAKISGTPLHYFLITTGDFPSGEAMKSAEARFIKRITDHQTSYGNVWEDVIKFAMTIDESSTDPEMVLKTMWSDASPRSDAELADTAVKKRAVGVPRSQLLREFGYDEEQVDRFLDESDAETVAKAALNMQPNDNGNEPPGNRQRSTAQPTGENTRGVRQ